MMNSYALPACSLVFKVRDFLSAEKPTTSANGNALFPFLPGFMEYSLLRMVSEKVIVISCTVASSRLSPFKGCIETSVGLDRKSTRLNSSHQIISYDVF